MGFGMRDEARRSSLVGLTSLIVSAYVKRNACSKAALPELVAAVGGELARARKGPAAPGASRTAQRPATPVKRSVFPDYVVCLEDGRRLKSLKRYLFVQFGLTPEQYRRKWGLPADYPMVAPNYAKVRSRIAIENQLGRSASGVDAARR